MDGIFSRKGGTSLTPRFAAALLLLLCLGAFSDVARNGFINLDDRLYVTENPMVARGVSAPGFVWAFTTTRAGNWHPATWLSHMLDVQLFGMEPGRHHLMSLALHAGSTLLLFAALSALTGAPWRGFFAAALFAVHPLRVESVAWAAERKDVLAMFFTLLALLAYVRGLRRPGTPARAATAGFFALALLAKPMPVTFPFLLLLLDWWPLGRWASLPPLRLLREKAALFALAAASAAITFAAQSRAGSVVAGEHIPLPARASNAVVSLVAYLADTLRPFELAVFYPHPYAAAPWTSWTASLLLLCAVCALAWRWRSRHPWFATGWFWYLGALTPMIGLVQVGAQARADRYTYLPHVGVFLLAVWCIAGSARTPRLRLAAVAGGVSAVLACAAITAALIPSWRSSRALFTRALERAGRHPAQGGPRANPALGFLHNSLGLAAYDEGRVEEAIGWYREALALNPASSAAMNNLGSALEAAGRGAEANGWYVRALLDARLAEPRINLGRMLMARGGLDDAIHLFREAVAIDPVDGMARAHLGAALALKGDRQRAEPELRAAAALAPGYEPAHFNLGKLLLEERRYEEAIGPLRESLRLEPGQAAAPALLLEARAGAARRVPPAAGR